MSLSSSGIHLGIFNEAQCFVLFTFNYVFLRVNVSYSSSLAPDPLLQSLVDNPGGGAIPKTKQPWPPLHTVKPDIGKKMEAQPGGDPPLLLPGRHNNRSDQTDPFEGDGVPKNGEENDRAADHYDAIENNGPQVIIFGTFTQCVQIKGGFLNILLKF